MVCGISRVLSCGNLRKKYSLFVIYLVRNAKVTIRSFEERQAKNLVLIGCSQSKSAKHFDYLYWYATMVAKGEAYEYWC